MSDKQKEKNSCIYINGKKSISQAIKLLQDRLENKKRNLRHKDEERSNNISLRCTSIPWQKKSSCTSLTAFSKSLFTLEMKTYLAKQNWELIQYLFPFLLGYSKDIEYLMWRYLLIILLYSPNSDSSNLQQFLELCIGNQELNNMKELEQLLLLQRKNSLAQNV